METKQKETKNIIIYSQLGYTYDFKNVEKIVNWNNTIIIEYTGVRSGTKNTAHFHSIAGYSVQGSK